MSRLVTSGLRGIALAACAVVLEAQAQTVEQSSPQASAQAPAPASDKTLASSVGLMVYPSKGQSRDQQAQDDAQCFAWARDQSGYDPMNPPPPPRAPLVSTGHSDDVARGAVGGAAVGAAGGALIGAIAGNAGKGAGIGAATGLLAGGLHAHAQDEREVEREKAQAQARIDEQQAARQELVQKFRRAMSVCLEARGYATK
jgi:hypothetical protein